MAAALKDRFPGDGRLSVWFQSLGHRWLEEAMEIASALGHTLPLLLLLAGAGLLLYARARWLYLGYLGLAGVGASLSPLLKELIGRPRPAPEMIQVHFDVGGNSFPSGHAFSAMLMLGMRCYLARPLCGERPWAVVGLRVFLGLLILAIGASRVYLGVHWTSDVLGGYLLGGLSLMGAIWLSKALGRRGLRAAA